MRAPWLAAWVAFVFFAWGASPSHYWLDSGEIGAAGFDLGVSHPPGAPGLGLLLRLATVVPLGSLGWRMALVSSALAAIAVGLVVAILERRGAGRALPCLAGAWVAVGLTFVRHGRVVEIYALAAALLMVALWGLDPRVPAEQRTSRRLLAVGAATWAAWCFGDLRLALGPVVLVAWLVAWRSREAWSRWAPVFAAMATLVILTLPLASAGAATADWGDPDSWSRFFDHLSARSIREAYAEEILPASAPLWWLHASEAIERLAEDLGAPGLVVAAIALGLTWRTEPDVPPRTVRVEALVLSWLVGTELLFAVGINPMGGADRQTGLVLAPMAALLVGEVLRRWLRDRGRLAWAVLPMATAVLVIPPALYGGPDLVVTRSWAPHAWTRAALAQLPPGTLLLTQSDDLAAGTISARLLEGARPDVVSIPAQHLYRPMPDAAASDPRQAVIWTAAAGESGEADRIVAAIAAHPGPVALELPRTSIFADVPWWSSRGRLPLAIGGVPNDREGAAEVSPPEEIERWLPRLPSAPDRERLAMALAGWARARIKVDGAVPLAAATLELSLSRVDDRHPSAMVTLAALRDRLGDTPGAIALTRRALELEPGRHAALTNLALYLSRDPQTREEAVIVARRAVELRPWRADGWARLAQILDVSGDSPGAASARARAQQATH